MNKPVLILLFASWVGGMVVASYFGRKAEQRSSGEGGLVVVTSAPDRVDSPSAVAAPRPATLRAFMDETPVLEFFEGDHEDLRCHALEQWVALLSPEGFSQACEEWKKFPTSPARMLAMGGLAKRWSKTDPGGLLIELRSFRDNAQAARWRERALLDWQKSNPDALLDWIRKVDPPLSTAERAEFLDYLPQNSPTVPPAITAPK